MLERLQTGMVCFDLNSIINMIYHALAPMQLENQHDSHLTTDTTIVVHPSSLSGSISSNRDFSTSSINSDILTEVTSSPDAQSILNSPTAPPYSPVMESASHSSEGSAVTVATNPSSPSQCLSLATQQPSTSSSPSKPAIQPTTCHGFKLVGDNIDKAVKPSYMGSDRQKQSLHYFHSYAVKDRVNSSSLSDNLPTSSWHTPDELCRTLLPSKDDSTSIHGNFKIHVARVLVKNLPAMKLAFDDLVDWHIEHQYSPEMSQRSEVVSRS